MFSDQYFGRDAHVMLSCGFGYFVDSANMVACFVFSDDLLLIPGTLIHQEPVAFGVCRLIAQEVKARQRAHWLNFFGSTKEDLKIYDHPLVKIGFREYMLTFLLADATQLEIGDAWGPSTYAEGVINILLLRNPEREHLDQLICQYTKDNTLTKIVDMQNAVTAAWRNTGIYRSPHDEPKSIYERCHSQVLVPTSIELAGGCFVGLYIREDIGEAFIAAIEDNSGRIQLPPNIAIMGSKKAGKSYTGASAQKRP